MQKTYTDQEVRITTMEVRDLEYTRQRLLECEWRVQLSAELLLYAQSLQNKDTHADNALLREIILGFDGIVRIPSGIQCLPGDKPVAALSIYTRGSHH